MPSNTAKKSRKQPIIESVPIRQRRVLSLEEERIRFWITQHHGVLTNVAREFGRSVQFVQRIAYNREAQSKGFRIECRLHAMGCPLAQAFPGKK